MPKFEFQILSTPLDAAEQNIIEKMTFYATDFDEALDKVQAAADALRDTWPGAHVDPEFMMDEELYAMDNEQTMSIAADVPGVGTVSVALTYPLGHGTHALQLLTQLIASPAKAIGHFTAGIALMGDESAIAALAAHGMTPEQAARHAGLDDEGIEAYRTTGLGPKIDAPSATMEDDARA